MDGYESKTEGKMLQVIENFKGKNIHLGVIKFRKFHKGTDVWGNTT